MLSTGKSAALAVLLAVLPVTPVLALHELDHRYDVAGYLLSADQQPIAGVIVVGHVDGERMGSGRSDSDGYYRFRMHLHDSALGRGLRLKTPEYEGTVRISLTPGDKSTERIHYVNFIGGELKEGELAGLGGISATLVAGVAGAIVLVVSVVATRHFRRLRRRRQRARQKVTKAPGQSAPKRRKRKNRKR